MPVSAGLAAKNALNAVRPPAEAPMPTIRGASLGSGGGDAVGTAGPSEGLTAPPAGDGWVVSGVLPGFCDFLFRTKRAIGAKSPADYRQVVGE